MSYPELIKQRLSSHFHRAAKPSDVESVVTHMTAVQAQDYGHAQWAIGVRLAGSAVSEVDQALDEGRIIRIHILRPTWHLVAAKDVRWMLRLSAPQIKKAMRSRERDVGLDAKFFNTGLTSIEHVLADHGQLTRQELVAALERSGLKLDRTRTNLLLWQAEIEALICSGPLSGKQQTYALLDSRVPMDTPYDRKDAIARLARRYFSSHAPATLEDFQWWSGLPRGDARTGLEAAAPELHREMLSGKEYWFSNHQTVASTADHPTVLLLPGFDEYIISYVDRDAVIDPADQPELITKNGIFRPAVLHQGRAIARWNRKFKPRSVKFEYIPFQNSGPEWQKDIASAAQSFADFYELKLEGI